MKFLSVFAKLNILLIVLSTFSFSQNLSKNQLLEFYPHNNGNSWSYLWVYYNSILDYAEAGRDYVQIVKDTSINSLKYYEFHYHYKSSDDYEIYFERIDSITGDVFRINDELSNESHLVDNIFAEVGDTINISENRFLLYSDKLVISSIVDTIINNFPTTIREVIGIPYNRKLFFARNIGMLGSGKNNWIDTANINGRIFSDISSDLTSLIECYDQISNSFELSQNYPNPFNPSTIIDINLPKSDFVTLAIYNLQGEKVRTLVDNKLRAGRHKINFESHSLSSGVYFYKLESNEQSIIKKMILLK